MTELVLVRHGETEYNRAGRFLGHGDEPLNETGRRQARRAAEIIGSVGGAFWSSDLRRCRETADAIGAGYRCAPELREMDFGAWEGLTWREIRERHPEISARFARSWMEVPAPDGESYRDMAQRVIGCCDEIIAVGGTAVVVTHAGCIRAIIAHYLLNDLALAWRFMVENGAVTRLIVDGDSTYLKSLNER